MLLAIDIGNTNIVVAVFASEQADEIKCSFRLTSKPSKTADEFTLLFTQLFELNNISMKDISGVIISSVVPQLNFEIGKFAENNFSSKPIFVADIAYKTGLNILLPNPAEVGSDRIVNAIAAFEKYRLAAIIIDFGTATTFDVINSKGDYLGGAIAPGVNLSLQALHKAAAKLPRVDIARPEKAIGKNTVSAMQSGIFFGYKGMVEGIIKEIKNEDQLNYKIIATGGLAKLFAKSTDAIEIVDENLTLDGLRIIYGRMTKGNK